MSVVFLHGFALDARMWGAQLEAFAGSTALDLPGFGGSADSQITMARAVAQHFNAHSLDAAHVVGLSLGAAAAVDFALTFPDRIRSLTLVDPLLRGRPSGIAAWDECVTHAKAGRLKEAAERWLADPLFAAVRRRPELFTLMREMAASYDGGHWTGRSSTRFEVADHASRLAEIAAPALVVVGSEDLPSFRAMADEYVARLPRAQLRVLPGVGHLSSLEAPADFNAALRELVR